MKTSVKTSWLSLRVEERDVRHGLDAARDDRLGVARRDPVRARRRSTASPEPQRRLTVKAGTRAGTPARSAATRATFTASGGCAMLPKMTWSSSAGIEAGAREQLDR